MTFGFSLRGMEPIYTTVERGGSTAHFERHEAYDRDDT